MVKTRLSTKKPVRTTPLKKLHKDNVIIKSKKNAENVDRCQNWIQQQRKEKPKYQADELNSDEDDDEENQQMRLDTISVRNFIFFVRLTIKKKKLQFPGRKSANHQSVFGL